MIFSTAFLVKINIQENFHRTEALISWRAEPLQAYDLCDTKVALLWYILFASYYMANSYSYISPEQNTIKEAPRTIHTNSDTSFQPIDRTKGLLL